MAFAREGYLFIAVATILALTGFVIAAILGSWIAWAGAYLLVILAIFVAFFFRDPERQGERGEHLIVAPADGRVMQITSAEEPTYLHAAATRVSIFLSLFNVHVQRSPVSGTVEYRSYAPGSFRAAWEERASIENERSSTGIRAAGYRILVRQIAGLVAQRIETYVQEGDEVQQGQRIGIIRFGSRVDTFVPQETQLRVRVGDRVYGGRTVLGAVPVSHEPDADAPSAQQERVDGHAPPEQQGLPDGHARPQRHVRDGEHASPEDEHARTRRRLPEAGS